MPTDNTLIKEISDSNGIGRSAEVIKASFQTVAAEFGLTEANAPTHPSNMTFENLITAKNKGLKLFGLFLGDEQVGFVAIDAANAPVFHFERLAVLPDYRHKGLGEELVKFACDYIKSNGGDKAAIGIIEEHTVLKDWYCTLGFKHTGTRKFSHLPFTVGFMEKDLGSR